ncbi:MAG: hypothetical protein C4541_07660 [Candidatus Auribacter fodinae]|uniref:Uncharacterized protein n=1 Tax=Candidatus Auribacter fodinae TaxID=2093366 RepID=A0A3A4R2D0_9BACT|nr:MAG: hypothetical protein C4541_07660 [Candidatus Auribacter fodinae]
MADCPRLQKCPFFNDQLDDMPDLSGAVKALFCKKNYRNCARYNIAKQLGPQNVPNNLFPADGRQANELLKKHKVQK